VCSQAAEGQTFASTDRWGLQSRLHLLHAGWHRPHGGRTGSGAAWRKRKRGAAAPGASKAARRSAVKGTGGSPMLPTARARQCWQLRMTTPRIPLASIKPWPRNDAAPTRRPPATRRHGTRPRAAAPPAPQQHRRSGRRRTGTAPTAAAYPSRVTRPPPRRSNAWSELVITKESGWSRCTGTRVAAGRGAWAASPSSRLSAAAIASLGCEASTSSNVGQGRLMRKGEPVRRGRRGAGYGESPVGV
jgi:hypothetical protein